MYSERHYIYYDRKQNFLLCKFPGSACEFVLVTAGWRQQSMYFLQIIRKMSI